ncbi:MAG TPA: porin [Steroidobacteraceae bacterium]|nr:porin [Steroidobacteraceae bacterium]
MNRIRGRWGVGGVLWMAAASVGALAGAAPAAGADAAAVSVVEQSARPATDRRPTIEELERRIEILEQKLDAQQRGAASAAAQPRAGAQAQAATQPQAGAQAQATPAVPARAASQEEQFQHPVTEQQAASATVSNPQIFAGPGGFSFQSPDGANQIRFHGEFDFDGRFYNDALVPDGSRSTWLLRRARPIVEGTFANIFDFRFNPDFAGGKTVIQDAFVAARFNPLFVVTAGKFKEPFGLERLQLSPNNRFIELGLPSDLVPNRDLGLQVSGTYAFASGTLIYQIGWFNGVADGISTDANATPDIDNNDDKDWAARLFAQPFSKTDIAALRGLGAGIAVSYVNQTGSPANTLLPTYKTETQRSFFGYDGIRTAAEQTPAAGAAYADGRRLRFSPQAYYYYKSFGLLGEYVGESQDVARTFGAGPAAVTRRATIKPDSWQLAATYLLTGDTASFGTVKPNRPFVIGQPGWGALEVAARVSALDLDSAAFINTAGAVHDWFANPGSQANKVLAWTAGLNWYLNQNVAWYLDYTVSRFDGGAPDGADRAAESAFFTRFQVAF